MHTTKKLVIFAIALCTIPLHAMKRPPQSMLEETASHKKQALDVEPPDAEPYFNTFSFLIQQKILKTTTIIDAHQKYATAIRTINRLSLTNKTLNTALNDQTTMFNCIKQISDKFNCSHQRVGRNLRIKMANEIHDWQELLYAGVCEALSSPHFTLRPLNRLIDMGMDINFTYCPEQKTLLAIALQAPYQNTTKRKIIRWLFENGAILAPITKNKDSAAALALRNNNQKLLEEILARPQFDPHHADCNGNTLLHHCFDMLQQRKRQGTATPKQVLYTTELIKRLLAMNIDISITNTKGTTALMMAERLGYISIINLLQKYIISTSM